MNEWFDRGLIAQMSKSEGHLRRRCFRRSVGAVQMSKQMTLL
jgi:hypothetical protein